MVRLLENERGITVTVHSIDARAFAGTPDRAPIKSCRLGTTASSKRLTSPSGRNPARVTCWPTTLPGCPKQQLPGLSRHKWRRHAVLKMAGPARSRPRNWVRLTLTMRISRPTMCEEGVTLPSPTPAASGERLCSPHCGKPRRAGAAKPCGRRSAGAIGWPSGRAPRRRRLGA